MWYHVVRDFITSVYTILWEFDVDFDDPFYDVIAGPMPYDEADDYINDLLFDLL